MVLVSQRLKAGIINMNLKVLMALGKLIRIKNMTQNSN